MPAEGAPTNAHFEALPVSGKEYGEQEILKMLLMN